MSPTQMRFTLRSGVKFSDGRRFTADDVVYSLNRAMAKTSNYARVRGRHRQGGQGRCRTRWTSSKAPNPTLLNQLTELRIMSKAWAEKNKSVAPKDIKTKDENLCAPQRHGQRALHGEGVGPDVKLVLVPNPNYWGKNATQRDRDRLHADQAPGHAARRAAVGRDRLRARPAPAGSVATAQQTGLKVVDGAENRTIFFGMDQFRDELPGSNVKGKNPLKDLRVRKALYQAIDIDALHPHDHARPVPAHRHADRAAGQRLDQADRCALPYDVDARKKLLAEAGYPSGFEVDFACPNNRYINDEAICQAVTAMWARIGVKAKLRTLPLVTYFPMIQRYEASIYMLGWGVPTFDALYSAAVAAAHAWARGGDGNYNVGRYSNPQMDALVERVKVETDLKVRNELIEKALVLSHEDVAYMPLHNQMIPWAMRKNVEVVHRADNRLDWRLIKVN